MVQNIIILIGANIHERESYGKKKEKSKEKVKSKNSNKSNKNKKNNIFIQCNY